jgi:nucleotide-binding universal stress UspA family protein
VGRIPFVLSHAATVTRLMRSDSDGGHFPRCVESQKYLLDGGQTTTRKMVMNKVQVDSRISVNNILFLTDFSRASERALTFVREIAREYGAHVSALHVLVPDVLAYMTPDSPAAALELQTESARAEMQRVETQLAGVLNQTVVVVGKEVWPAVEPRLKEDQVDLIVLGTSGRTGLPKLLVGSTAEEVFRRSPVAVMTIGPSVHGDNDGSGVRWERVVFASDFTPESLTAAPYAISFAEENDAQLTLLHVIEVWGQRRERNKQGLTVAEAMHQLHEIVPPETVVEHGEPGARILEVAKQRRADLIVLGIRSTSHMLAASHLEGSIAHTIVAHATCPVLTVRS